jgi:hypothetical protein
VLSPTYTAKKFFSRVVFTGEAATVRFHTGFATESVFDLVGVLINRLATALGLLGLPCHGTALTREDRSGVEDPGADR